MNPLARAIDHLLGHTLARPPLRRRLPAGADKAAALAGGVLGAHAGQDVLAGAEADEQRERRQPHAQPEVRRNFRKRRVARRRVVVVRPVCVVHRGVRRRLEVLEPCVVVRQHEHCGSPVSNRVSGARECVALLRAA